MQLQKETLTTRFESIHHQAIVNVFHTGNWCNEKLKQTILPFEVTTQQFNILRILRGQYPNACTVNFLKTRMLDKMCDASRIIDRLVQKGLVLKASNAEDKRAVDILISDKGLALLKEMDKDVSLSVLISSNLTEEEARLLNDLLDKMRG
ncbi:MULTISPECIES: MarR family winged helix-turn-helix transcriptional regulator [Pedobacter]|uniref:Regulatory protein MarR n=1 Tax=Pedobacter heparinus (strain ATCC 13125 / DSM 2366 / CIP 104194 / JCM 7457 / NBRC 12017 / NCIMB 9290 / NRRL B-14731 / HIM 762-3) TaxID=485917 RepID=C6XT61_PEDHD|nr:MULTISPECIES: MarR family transcriptional regulator [Pedobacter]ACU03622.1 regulatory protein MarR [Pedobacter heparinus DSM 2366]MBB5436866.1 DNA-binding MarR family transcriptional regulator [Pedobacter sp. AK017]